METRQCKVCSRNLPLIEPHYILKKDNKTWKYFYLKTCAECYRAKERERINSKYATDPNYKAKCNERSRKYVLSDEQKQMKKISIAKRQKNNPDKMKEMMKKRTDKNRERLNEYWREYAKNNRDKINENYSKYHQSTIEWNFLERCKSRRKQAKKKYNLSDSVHMHDLNKNSFWELYDKQEWKCAITGISLILVDPNTNEPYLLYEVDHIYPISKWWLHSITNLQLTYPPANWSKWDTIL